jgi:solute carrier family 25 carnitine/acylcarnitine transporter 20/29
MNEKPIMNDNIKSFIAGSITGITETFFGYSLDTIKVNIQNNKEWKFNRLYKGVHYALKASILTNSFVFGFNNFINNKYNLNSFESGFLTGFVNGIFITPFENKKIQLQNNIKDIKYFKAIELTILRESIGCSIYFGSYNILKNKYHLHSLISGGGAGILSWALTYQIDLISTRLKSNTKLNIYEAIKMGNLWRGFSFCIIRSMIVSSINFYTYEQILILSK